MWRQRFAIVFCLLGFAGLVFGNAGAAAEEPPPPPQGVDVLTRGPVHEAFAQAVDVSPAPTPVVPKQPPDPIEELPPDQKPAGDNVQWIPGYWAWDQDQSDFVWVSGIWRVPPPDRQWVPGHWQKVEGGWQWVPGFWMAVGQTQVSIVPAPPASLDQGPVTPAPDANSTYVPGCWVYEGNRYLWRPGFWIPFYPGWVWIPAHYQWTPSGAIFVEGFWDRPLEERGLLFAPVRLDRQLLVQRNWHFTPSYVIRPESLLTSLFVGPAGRHYYFGDYFGPHYQTRGFVPWTDYRINRHSPDPLFSYYRHLPDGARWERDLRDLHTAWHTGQRPLPPRTLVQQNQVLQNLRREPASNNTAINQATVVHPLPRMQSPAIKLGEVTKEQHLQARQSAEWYRQMQQQRQAHEAPFVGRAPAPMPHPGTVRTMQVPQAPHPAPAAAKTPPPPIVPKHVEKPR